MLLVGACGPHEEVTPPIPVVRDAAKRSMWLPSHVPGAAGANATVSAPARVHALKAGEELGGPNAVGRPGDWLLDNDEVAFVIDQMGSSAGFAESGGNLMDAADAHDRKDELGQLFSYFGTFPRQGVYETLTNGAGADGSAWIEARGHELYEPLLEVVTRYTLRPGERGLLIETSLSNKGAQPVSKLSLGDAIQWGGAEKFAPGKPVGFRGVTSGPFIGAVGRFTSYAITGTEGTIDGISGGSWTDTAQIKDVTLGPGQTTRYVRVFAVGMRADTASVVAELANLSGERLGGIEIELVDALGKAVSVPDDAKLVLSNEAGADVMSIRAGRAGGPFGGEVPKGRYQVRYASGGGRTGLGPRTPVEALPGGVAKARLAVSAAASITVVCAEVRTGNASNIPAEGPVPCKVTFEGVAGTASPSFGPAHAAGPAKNQVTSATGEVKVAIAPGKYRVTLSRGPEYEAPSFETEIAPGSEPRFDKTFRRVVDTKGYVATDFHQHTMLSSDAPVAVRDRVVANAAEAVEVAVASEHNVVADLEPIVRELGLTRYLVEVPGDELTSDASKKPWGHANVFPLDVDAGAPRGGAPAVRDRTAREVFAELRAIRTPHVLQINHPRSGLTGYFDQYALDIARGVGKDPGYDPQFDALEVWNGRNVDARDRVLDDFFALLATKHPVTATADTDTHGIVGQEAGYPRTYVRVQSDDALEPWDRARSDDLVKGVRERRDVVLTNGPFLRVSANGAPIGGIARAKGGKVEVVVHVESAPWVKVDTLTIRSAAPWGTPKLAEPAISMPVDARPLPSGALGADLKFALSAKTDNAFVVIVSGGAPMTPVLAGDPKEITPYAMTGAIWVDADGDGRALGR